MHDPNARNLPPAFHRLTISNLLAHTAEQIGLAATPLVAVLVLHAGAEATAILQAAQTLPFLLFSLPLGPLADTRSRTRLMASDEIVRVLSLILVLGLMLTNMLTLPILAIIGFAGTVGTVAYTVAAPSLVSSLVPASHLLLANGRIELVRSVAYTAGPAIGGALVGWSGATWAYVVGIVVSSGAVIALSGIPDRGAVLASLSRPVANIRVGMDSLLSHPLLRPILLTAIVFNVSWFCLQGVYVAYAIAVLGHSTTQVGIVLALYGAGMLAGALATPRITRNLPFGHVVVLGPLAGQAAAIVMVMTIWLPVVVLPALTYILLGAGPIIWTISTTTLSQSVTPHTMLGRVSAGLTTATAGSRPLGAGLGALIAATGGVQLCLTAAAGGFLIQALIILASPVAALDHQPSTARPEFAGQAI